MTPYTLYLLELWRQGSSSPRIGGSMSKHTAGPWEFNPPVAGDNTAEFRAGNANGTILGAIYPLFSNEVEELLWTEEAEANARLIAAAPELLEALKARVRRCPLCSGDGCVSCEEDRKLISKAEGRA
jgi:hypothetical protein